jgi:hypothetical protein
VALRIGEAASNGLDFAFDLVRDLVDSTAQCLKITLGLLTLGFGKQAELFEALSSKGIEVGADLPLQIGENGSYGFGLVFRPVCQLASLRFLDALGPTVESSVHAWLDDTVPPTDDFRCLLCSDGLISGGAEQGIDVAKGVNPTPSAAAQPAPGDNQLLVQTVAVSPGDH